MKRKQKNLLIWIMFGVYLGIFIARAMKDIANTGIFDWVLIVAGIITAIIHYSPEKTDKTINQK